jgi:hypothetical protein
MLSPQLGDRAARFRPLPLLAQVAGTAARERNDVVVGR